MNKTEFLSDKSKWNRDKSVFSTRVFFYVLPIHCYLQLKEIFLLYLFSYRILLEQRTEVNTPISNNRRAVYEAREKEDQAKSKTNLKRKISSVTEDQIPTKKRATEMPQRYEQVPVGTKMRPSEFFGDGTDDFEDGNDKRSPESLMSVFI